jgi:hypothetical protein
MYWDDKYGTHSVSTEVNRLHSVCGMEENTVLVLILFFIFVNNDTDCYINELIDVDLDASARL